MRSHHKPLTFSTRGGALSHPNLFPVVLPGSSGWLTSRHLVVRLMRRESPRLDYWEGPHRLPHVSACLTAQILLLIIHCLCHIQLAIKWLSWENRDKNILYACFSQ